MFCLYLADHREVDAVIARHMGKLNRLIHRMRIAHISLNEFVYSCQDILVPGNIVECVWPILFYPYAHN